MEFSIPEQTLCFTFVQNGWMVTQGKNLKKEWFGHVSLSSGTNASPSYHIVTVDKPLWKKLLAADQETEDFLCCSKVSA